MNLTKLPKKKKVTVNDLLTTDNVNTLINELVKKKNRIKELVIIATYRNDDDLEWLYTPISLSRLIYLLEASKIELMTNDREVK